MDKDFLMVILFTIMFMACILVFAGAYKESNKYDAMSRCAQNNPVEKCKELFGVK